MRTRRGVVATFVLVVLTHACATGRAMAAVKDPSYGVVEHALKDWVFSVSIYTYLAPNDQNYVQPTITADRDWLHLEARYNYEDLVTGSLWVGYNWSVGKELSLSVTRCWAACSAAPPASRPAPRSRWIGGSLSSTAKASTCSIPMIRLEASSTRGRS